jgi:proline iminopeptidase
MITVDGKYQVWTKQVGNGKIKVLTLHGGPGLTHEYLECFEDFLPQAGIEFYYYEQLGSHYSDQPTNTSLWTIDRFSDEVEQVRKGLGLDHFYLYGHSWGGMLAMEYAFKYQEHLKGLILSDMTAGIRAYEKHAVVLRSKLPPDVLQVLEKYEGLKQFDAPEYQDVLMNKVYPQFFCRLKPWPEPILRTFKHINQDIYNYMQGPNEFFITGTFRDWDVWDKLPTIKVPTLCIGGTYDTMNPDDIRREGRLIPRSRVLITNGSHMCMYDDQQTYFKGLIKFLKDVDGGRFK